MKRAILLSLSGFIFLMGSLIPIGFSSAPGEENIIRPSALVSLPTAPQGFSYDSIASPVVSDDPSGAKPVGVGTVADGGDTLSLHISLGEFEGLVDIYFGFSLPTTPSTVHIMTQTGSIKTLSEGIAPWKQNVSGPVDEKLFGDLPVSALPTGTYQIYFLVSPHGNLNSYYFWTTKFTATMLSSVLKSASISPTIGGILKAASDDDGLNGASVDIPAGAVSETLTLSIGTLDSLPKDSPYGQVPVGKLFGVEPSGLSFAEDVTLSLPIPAGAINSSLYMGRWDEQNKTWENLGGTVDGDFISTRINHLSIYGVFNAGRSLVRIVNQVGEDPDELGIEVTYISGPNPPPDLAQDAPFPAYRPLPAGGVDLKHNESRLMALLPGRYHFVVSYPHPQPGVANNLLFTIPVQTEGADDSQIDQTITITLDGARSTDLLTDASINFPGRDVVAGSNLRPSITCTATAPEGVPVVNGDPGATSLPSRVVTVGPIKVVQLFPKGSLNLSGTATDPESSSPIHLFWTWSQGTLPAHDDVATGGTKTRGFLPNPVRSGVYTVYLTAYDEFDLFDECRWDITVVANTKPTINVVPDDFVIDFGRLDSFPDRRTLGAGPDVYDPGFFTTGTPTLSVWKTYVASPSTPGGAVAPDGTDIIDNLCYYVGGTTYLRTFPAIEKTDVSFPDDSHHKNPIQHPYGMTCVFAIIDDADGDPLTAGFELPLPQFGRGNFYTAIPIPSAATEIPMPDGKSTVSDHFPTGYPIGGPIWNQLIMDAYNATLSFAANLGLLPVTAPLPSSSVTAQALPVIWEAPDNPDPCLTTHDCNTHTFICPAGAEPDICEAETGGTVNIEARVTDDFSREQRDYGTVGYFPDGEIDTLTAPVCDDQTVTTDENTRVRITLSGTDLDGDRLIYSVVDEPSHGRLSGFGSNLTYTPENGYSGKDFFTFTAKDGRSDCGEATVSITVRAVNDPPVADDQTVTTGEDSPVSITLSGSDPDGDILTYTVVDQPRNGSLSGSAPDLTYTPDDGYSGSDSFTFTVNDGQEGSAEATVRITVERAPDEFLVWYTENVTCWSAPYLFVTTRDGFETPRRRCNFSGGGLCGTKSGDQEVIKVEMQGGFSSSSEARDWICNEVTAKHFHRWCGFLAPGHLIIDGQPHYMPGNMGCDWSKIPEVPIPDDG